MVDAARVELASTGCKPAVGPFHYASMVEAVGVGPTCPAHQAGGLATVLRFIEKLAHGPRIELGSFPVNSRALVTLTAHREQDPHRTRTGLFRVRTAAHLHSARGSYDDWRARKDSNLDTRLQRPGSCH